MSWKDLSELAPSLSEAEIRFEKKRRLVGLILGPALFLVALAWPPLSDVTPLGMRTLGIFLWAVVWWVLEPVPIPVTSFFSLALLVLCGILPVERAFIYWANWVNIFLIGAFIIAHAISVHGLPRRIAFGMMASRFLQGSPARLLMVFAIGTALFSSVLSNVATTVIFLSIAMGLSEALDFPRESRYGEALFISIAWGAGIGGIISPVGSPPNAIVVGMMREQLDYRMGFLPWVEVFLPVALVAMGAMYLVMRYVLRPQIAGWKVSTAFAEEELQKLGPLRPGEKITAGALAAAIFFWMLPDLARLAAPEHPAAVWLYARLDWSVTAIVVATSLFLIPVNWKKRQFVLTWGEAAKGVDWGTLSLIASALALGNVIADRDLGLGRFFEQSLSSQLPRPFDPGFYRLHHLPDQPGLEQRGGQHVGRASAGRGPSHRRQPDCSGIHHRRRQLDGLLAAHLNPAERHRIRQRPGSQQHHGQRRNRPIAALRLDSAVPRL